MADKKIITPEEKALLQAKHRLEAVQARDRRKERNARTSEELRHFLSFHLQKHD